LSYIRVEVNAILGANSVYVPTIIIAKVIIITLILPIIIAIIAII
jgi:hypothetical protein